MITKEYFIRYEEKREGELAKIYDAMYPQLNEIHIPVNFNEDANAAIKKLFERCDKIKKIVYICELEIKQRDLTKEELTRINDLYL